VPLPSGPATLLDMFRRTLTISLSGLALVLSACGGGGSKDNGVSSQSANDIVNSSLQAIKDAKSVHVSGSTTSGSAPIKLDLQLVAGKGGTGSMTVNGSSFQIVAIGQSVYIKADASFWKQFGNEQTAQLLTGHWLKATATGQFASFAQLTNLNSLFTQLLSQHGTLAKGSATTVNGQKVIAINDKTKGGTLYVATTGKPYPIEVAKGGSAGGKIDFDKVGASVTLTAPSGAISIPSQ
jgi:hypothetical protein